MTSLRSSYRIPVYGEADDGIEPWLNLSQAAAVVGVAARTLRLAAERGDIAYIRDVRPVIAPDYC